MRLKGQVAVVTGAGRGIGRAIAHTLAGEGATVVLVARTRRDLDAVKQEIDRLGGSALVMPADVTDDRQVENVFAGVDRMYHRLDILVNNAGVGTMAAARDLGLDDLDRMWRLNVRAVVKCTQEGVRRMESQKSGVVVQISSLAGKNAFVGGSGYAATKWALMGFSKCLMLEEREHNIRVILVCPGSVDTSFSAEPRSAERAAKILAPQDVADAVLTALSLPARAMMSEIDLRPTNPK